MFVRIVLFIVIVALLALLFTHYAINEGYFTKRLVRMIRRAILTVLVAGLITGLVLFLTFTL